MRCFLAVDIPVEIKQSIERAAVRARKLGVRATFVAPEQIHVTLAFFGEIGEKEVEEKKRILAAECASASAFKVKIRGIDFLPDVGKSPRVFYAVVFSPELIELQAKLAAALHYDEGRSFHSHATIARFKQSVYRESLKQLVEEFEREEFGEFTASEIVLKKSVLGADGATHTVIARFPLKGSASAT